MQTSDVPVIEEEIVISALEFQSLLGVSGITESHHHV